MKIAFTKEAQKYVTVSEMPAVRKMINEFKEDTSTVEEYAAMAARLVVNGNVRIIEAKAEIAKNCRVWNAYSDESCQLDIWITFMAVIEGLATTVVMGGAYLTDIWEIGDPEWNKEIAKHMYIRKFVEVR